MISVMMITLDRFEVTSSVIAQSLVGQEGVEFLVCDNGSKDRRIVDYVASLNPRYHRVNSANEGCAKAFNQLVIRTRGEYLCLMGNDIQMPKDWLTTAVRYINAIPNCGLVGFDWGHSSSIPPLSMRLGIGAHWLTPQFNRVFGTMVFPRGVVSEIGLFHEGYGPYGIEDSDFCERANLAGFNSCYIPGMKSQHLVNDVGEDSEYRKVKDRSLGDNATIFSKRAILFNDMGVREPLPPLRDPI